MVRYGKAVWHYILEKEVTLLKLASKLIQLLNSVIFIEEICA